MDYEKISIEERGRVGILYFDDSSRRLEFFSDQMLRETYDAIERWNDSPHIGAVVLTGRRDDFCAGADFAVFAAMIEGNRRGAPLERWRPDEDWLSFIQRSKPVVCAIDGLCIGIGLTLTLCCDVRIASDRARLSARFVRSGLIPEVGSTRLLVEITGLTNALELMLTGRLVDAADAERVGLVRVVPAAELLDRAVEVAAEIASNPSDALATIKQLVWQNLTETDLAKVMSREEVAFLQAMQGPAFEEAMNAFSEKRRPSFHDVDPEAGGAL